MPGLILFPYGVCQTLATAARGFMMSPYGFIFEDRRTRRLLSISAVL